MPVVSGTGLDPLGHPARHLRRLPAAVRLPLRGAGPRRGRGPGRPGVARPRRAPRGSSTPPATSPAPGTRSLDLGRRLWRDDIARYRPQVEEARRDYFAMLESWWQAEGEGPTAPEVLAVEHPFDIEVAGHRLRGAIDRIDRADDGHGIRILDYKTGKSEPTRAQAADTNLQLAVYHLAATRDPELAALGPAHPAPPAVPPQHAVLRPGRRGRDGRGHRGPHRRRGRAHPGRGVPAGRRRQLPVVLVPAALPHPARGPAARGRAGRPRGVTTFTPTDEQADAIEAPLTPQLLVAGAGAGKTTVMAHRILHVVQSGQARADQILALTFTNKAAQHLKQRVREVLGPDADATVATYHSFGASLVADHALELDLAPGTRVLNRAESWQLLFAVFDEFRFDRRSTLSPEFVLTDALNLASRAADHLVPVEAIVADCHEVQAANRWKRMSDTAASRLELCQVVAAYERRKRARDLLDFDDQVGLAVRLLTDHPEVADDLRLRHPVVLLDEYQDTNFAQRRLLQLVYPAGSAITAVGDDMQSIYGFRGAHLANILSFPQHFPPVTPRPLQTTFRFGATLGRLANRIQGQVEHSLSEDADVRARRAGHDDRVLPRRRRHRRGRRHRRRHRPAGPEVVRQRGAVPQAPAHPADRRRPPAAGRAGGGGGHQRPARPARDRRPGGVAGGAGRPVGVGGAPAHPHRAPLPHRPDATSPRWPATAASWTRTASCQTRSDRRHLRPRRVGLAQQRRVAGGAGAAPPVRGRAPRPREAGGPAAGRRPGRGHPGAHRPVAGRRPPRPGEPAPPPRPGRALPARRGRPRPGRASSSTCSCSTSRRRTWPRPT